MKDYLVISVIALYFYVFFLLAFVTAKRNRIINNFIMVLLNMVIWTGGSLMMRAQIWPSYRFWYHISVAGIWLLPYTYFCFIREFAQEKRKPSQLVWLLAIIVGILINMKTGFFLAPPDLVEKGGQQLFVYRMHWPVMVMYGLSFAMLVKMLCILSKVKKQDPLKAMRIMPLVMGMLVLFAGNLGVSVFKEFPIDILAGVCNAILMFTMLYCGRVFKLTLLVSEANCYAMSMGISVLVFFNLAKNLDLFIKEKIPALLPYSVMLVTVLTMLLTLTIYTLMKALFNRLFVRDEQMQTEKLTAYTMEVSKSLKVNEIYSALVTVITDTLHVKKVYICTEEQGGSYRTVYSTSPLDDKSFSMDGAHPLVEWMKKNDQCLLFRDFKRTINYKSLWEEEKRRLEDMRVECFLPLKDNEELVGIVMLSEKEKKGRGFGSEDINFLNSIESVSSIAIKNSNLYERAYMEARTDELTGLLNRKCFYETLDEIYEKCKRTSMSLLIFNVDDFKLYNQLYGNQEGDKALRHIARIISGTVGENGYVARYSGKEFAVILPEFDIYSSQNLAENVSNQIRSMNKTEKDGYLKVLTVSCGICGIPYAAVNVRELVQNTDQAVYHVKHSGKNGIMIYSEGVISSRKSAGLSEKHKSMYSEYAPTIYALTAAIDAKDHYTFQHSKNVAYYAENLAIAMNMSEEYRGILKEAALLHDIGKIGVTEQILNKKGPLSENEFEAMKGHVEYSVGIIRHLPSLDYVIPAVLGHHERYDGKGYPRHIAGKDIPLAARILCIADSFDAMVSKRCYKPSKSVEYAIDELDRGAGAQFDPELVPLFINLLRSGRVIPVIGKEEPEEWETKGLA